MLLNAPKALALLSLLSVVCCTNPVQGQGQQRPVYGPAPPSLPATKANARPAATPAGIPPNRQAQNQPVPNQPAQPPAGYPAVPTKRVNDMLTYWEQKTSTIKTFRTEFARWIYDPVFGPKDGNAKTVSIGEIRYAAPDRGMIKETEIAHYDAEKAQAGEKWPFKKAEGEVGEHWVCDGQSVFEFDHTQKKLVETQLPPDMRGNAIAEGPLPFMFGAKAQSIRDRYWIREIPRSKPEDAYQLELAPKHRGESFAGVTIHLDPKEFMPTRMDVVDLNRRSKMVYQFKNRRINSVTDNVKNFWDSFVSPKPPRGWTKIVQNPGQPAADDVGPQQARGPATQQR